MKKNRIKMRMLTEDRKTNNNVQHIRKDAVKGALTSAEKKKYIYI